MDNITHSVIGLVAGDVIHHATNPRQLPSIERRRLFLLASIFGNNLPDLDVLYTKILPPPIGSLLHHRGYTHTLMAAIPQALIVLAVLFLLRGGLLSKRLSRGDWALAFVTALVGVCLHVFADSWNSYGVHPFYPFDNRWYYGDFIFIIEPLLWMTLGSWILLELSLVWRILYFAAFGVVIGYGFKLQAIQINQIFILITLLSSITLVAGLFSSAKRSMVAMGFASAVLVFFNIQSSKAKEAVHHVYETLHLPPIEDLSLSPLPMNPFCWTVLAASREYGDFVVRKGTLSLWPKKFTNEACRLLDPNIGAVRGMNDEVDWTKEVRTTIKEFSRQAGDCYLKDWLRFSRFPQIDNGIARDLRFANRGIRNFTELKLQPGRECLTNVPPWTPPRNFLESM